MIRHCFVRAISLILLTLFALTPIAGAGDEPPLKASEQWRKDLHRLVVLSRFVADKPSLLGKTPSPEQARALSADPFACGSPDVSDCLLSQIASVLLQQATGSANIFYETQGAAVHINSTRATDGWSNKDIENNWDVVKKWTDAVGPAALLVGAFMLSQNSSNDAAATLIGSGAALILVGNIGTLGQLYGGVNDKQRAQAARKTINALQEIEVSRQAYENSQLLFGFLESYSNKAKKLLQTIVTLSNEAEDLSKAAPSAAKSRKLVELCDTTRAALSGFTENAGLAGEYAHQLLRLYKKSQDEVSPPADKKAFEDARQGAEKFSDTYNEAVVPFLEGVDEEMEALQNIKAAVIANSIEDKRYF